MYRLQLRIGVSHTRQSPSREAFEFQGELTELPEGVAASEGVDLELPGLLAYYPILIRIEHITTNGGTTELRGYLWCHTDGDFCYHEDTLRDVYGIVRHHEIAVDDVIPAPSTA